MLFESIHAFTLERSEREFWGALTFQLQLAFAFEGSERQFWDWNATEGSTWEFREGGKQGVFVRWWWWWLCGPRVFVSGGWSGLGEEEDTGEEVDR